MTRDPRKAWESLFERALELIDSALAAGVPLEPWTFGGGTVLMRRHRHRFSKDVDIFVPDPQVLGYLTPRLNAHTEALTANYVEQGNFLKLLFPEGEIDFVASGPLTGHPFVRETVLGRLVCVETSAEIVAKKVWHRAEAFTARDVFDLAMVVERETEALHAIAPILRDRREVLRRRIASHDTALREAFAGLAVLEYRRSYDECVALVERVLARA